MVLASVCFWLGGSLICTSDEKFSLERGEMETGNPEQCREGNPEIQCSLQPDVPMDAAKKAFSF